VPTEATPNNAVGLSHRDSARVKAVQRSHRGSLASNKAGLTIRRGINIGNVAADRKLLTRVFYGLREGHIRRLPKTLTAV
jgi:hypothetical protein